MLEEQDLNIKHITFKIDDNYYAIDILHIIEIIDLLEVTKIPDSPSYILGVINLRNQIIPVMDTRYRLLGEKSGYGEQSSLIVITVNNQKIAIYVDRVLEVLDIPEELITNSHEIIEEGNIKKKFIKGVGLLNDKLYLVLNTDYLLS